MISDPVYADDHTYLDKHANAFARCLLMQEKMVRETWPLVCLSHWKRPVDEMAQIFCVEKVQMAIRLAELDLI
jgi:Zn-dependent peptidase ImmA (M78 family)